MTYNSIDIAERKHAEEALRESTELFSLFMRYSPVYTYIKEVTPTRSLVLQASENFADMIGIPGSEMVGKAMMELFPHEFAAKITADDWAVVSKGEVLRSDEKFADRHYHTIKFPIVREGKTLLAGYTIDITEQKRGEVKLLESEARLRLATEATGFGVYDYNFINQEAYYSPEFLSLFELPQDSKLEIDQDGVAFALHPEDRDHFLAYMKAANDPTGSGILDIEYRIITTTGEIRWLRLRGRTSFSGNTADDRPLEANGIVQDITKRKQAEEQVQQLVRQLEIEKDYAEKNAITDSLTGLANRRYFDEALNSEFYRAKRTGSLLSLIMLDIDHFKQFNDTYGHLAGDECLRQLATAIGTIVLRAPDVAARYGGEEFVIILPETHHHGAVQMAENIRRAVAELAIPHSTSLCAEYVSISLGVVTVSAAHVSEPTAVLALADKALYTAKERGRNRIEIAIPPAAPDSSRDIGHSDFVRLVWRMSDECGNATIDEQHRKLFEVANVLLSAVISGHPKDECMALLESLLTDVVNHFRDEEALLGATAFPLLEYHRHCHSDLVQKTTELADKYRNDELKVGELFSFLAYDVIARHMFTEDRKFMPYIIKKYDMDIQPRGRS